MKWFYRCLFRIRAGLDRVAAACLAVMSVPVLGIRSPSPYDEGQYPVPEFTEEEHEAARSEGCMDAYERWQWMTDTRRFMNSHDRMHAEGKAAFRRDLESIGLPPEVLGAVSKAGRMLPNSPNFEYPTEVNVPKDAEIRQACIDGMHDYLDRLYEKLESLGIDPDANPESDAIPLEHRDTVRNIHQERARTIARIEAFTETEQDTEASRRNEGLSEEEQGEREDEDDGRGWWDGESTWG